MNNIEKEGNSRNIRALVILLLLAGALVLTAGAAFASLPAGTSVAGLNSAKQVVQPASVTAYASQPVHRPVLQVTEDKEPVQVIDLTKLGVHPVQSLPSMPDGGVIGTISTFMSVSPDVVSQTTTNAAAFIASGFTSGETVNVAFNGIPVGSAAANAFGRVASLISTNTGEGIILITLTGATSGKQAGGVLRVLDNAPQVPGVAVAPHAIGDSATVNIGMISSRYPASTNIALAIDGSAFSSATTQPQGYYYTNITFGTGPDASYSLESYITGTLGSMAGASIEQRADAGTPPAGDQNVSRGLMDRGVVSSTITSSFTFVGEGFQAGEVVTLSGCAASTGAANANGGVKFTLNTPPAAGTYNCVATGSVSGRVARGTVQAAALVRDVPGAIAAPSNVAPGSTFTLSFDRLLPSQTGAVYLDGVNQGAAATNANGTGSMIVVAPVITGIHELEFQDTAGEVAIAPLFVLTPTVIPSVTSTGTATGTALGTSTSTGTPTASATASSCTPLLSEGFESSEGFPPTGWVITNHSEPIGTTSWFQGAPTTFNAQSGSPDSYAAANFSNTSDGTISDWFLSPPVQLQNGRVFSFWTRTRTGSPYPDRMQVRLSTNGASTNVGTTSADVGDFTTMLADINSTETVGGYPENWTQYSVTLSGISGTPTGRFAFRYYVHDGGPDGTNSNYIGVDTVSYNNANCVATATSTATSTSTGTPTSTSTAQATATTTRTAVSTSTSTASPSQTGQVIPSTQSPSVTATACTITYTDVDQYNPFYKYIQCLTCRGIVSGFGDGTFRPNAPISRGEAAKMIANAAGFHEAVSGQSFPDVHPSDTFYMFIERLAQRHLIGGYPDGLFRSTQSITRGELSKIDSNAAGFSDTPPSGTQTFEDVLPSDPFYLYIERLSKRGIINGYTCGVTPAGSCDAQHRAYFLPNVNITRGQASKIVANTFFPIDCAPGRPALPEAPNGEGSR